MINDNCGSETLLLIKISWRASTAMSHLRDSDLGDVEEGGPKNVHLEQIAR